MGGETTTVIPDSVIPKKGTLVKTYQEGEVIAQGPAKLNDGRDVNLISFHSHTPTAEMGVRTGGSLPFNINIEPISK